MRGGTVKTYTLPICKPTVLVRDNANAQLVVRAREAGAGAKSEQGWGGVIVWKNDRLESPLLRT